MATQGLVQKLTPKVLGWNRATIGAAVADVPAAGGRVYLGRVAGIVSDIRQTVDGDTGEIQNGLKGQFRGISSLNRFEQVTREVEGKQVPVRDDKDKIVVRDTGEKVTVTAGVCYLPSGIQGMLEGALAAAKEQDARATVNFAMDLYALPDTNKAGYTFEATNLVPAAAVDPLSQLLEAAEEHARELPQLEAPQADSEGGGTGGEPEKAPEPATKKSGK